MENKKRLVYADEVEDLINGLDSLPWEEDVHTLVNSLSTVDAMEIVHGRWVPCGFGKEIMCSACRCELGDVWEYRYCPNCGAKMDVGVNNE